VRGRCEEGARIRSAIAGRRPHYTLQRRAAAVLLVDAAPCSRSLFGRPNSLAARPADWTVVDESSPSRSSGTKRPRAALNECRGRRGGEVEGEVVVKMGRRGVEVGERLDQRKTCPRVRRKGHAGLVGRSGAGDWLRICGTTAAKPFRSLLQRPLPSLTSTSVVFPC